MTRERVAALLHDNKIPQNALVRVVGISASQMSVWLRSEIELSERWRDEIAFALTAMLELQDEAPLPVDWRQTMKLKPLLDEKIAAYKRARVADLRREFQASQAVA